jgi:hypothetical protein
MKAAGEDERRRLMDKAEEQMGALLIEEHRKDEANRALIEELREEVGHTLS